MLSHIFTEFDADELYVLSYFYDIILVVILWYVISQLPRLVNGFEILVITFIISISIQVFAITFMVTRLTYDWSTALQNF